MYVAGWFATATHAWCSCLLVSRLCSRACASSPAAKPPSSCKQILAINPNAASDHYQIWVDAVGVTDVYCDMDTDGGGWTVLYANPGANTTLSFTSADAANELSASPLSNDAYNLPQAVKAALSTVPSETLVRQSPSVWIRVDHSPVDAAFGALANSSGLWPAQEHNF